MEKPGNKKRITNMNDVRIRKKKLKDDLELLEGNFEKRIHSTRKRIFGPLQPVSFIKNQPFFSVGIAIAAGFMLGLAKKGGSQTEKQPPEKSSGKDTPDFTGILFDEMKRIAARRAASYISDFVDQKLSENKKK
jgi:hypothetical protein